MAPPPPPRVVASITTGQERLAGYLYLVLSRLGLSSTAKRSSRSGLIDLVLKNRTMLLTIAKALVGALFLVNVRSWPLVWHVRIWYWAIAKRLSYRFFRLSSSFSSPSQRARAEDAWVEKSLLGMGKHPWEYVSVYHSWASLDESDFNMHLSNSSYAKTLDAARFKVAMELFMNFFRGGGWIPLAATQYHFVCEIPILASYEVRSRIGGWDEKWFYVISKFVMPANKSKKKVKATQSKSLKPVNSATSSSPSASSTGQSSNPTNPDGMPILHTPSCTDEVNSEAPSGAATPFGVSSGVNYAAVAATLSGAKTSTAAAHPSTGNYTTTAAKLADLDEFDVEEPDGAQVHTVAISRCCFKVGRITVPPALVFAVCGLTAEDVMKKGEGKGKVASGSPMAYPPHWSRVVSTLSALSSSSSSASASASKPGPYGTYDPRALAKLMKGAHRDVPEDEKWWKQAFDGAFEVEREERVERLGRRL